MKALLLSGGLDSSALAYWLRPDRCVTLNYGQRAAAGEIAAATAICANLSLEHAVLSVDLRSFGSGSMAERPEAAHAAAPEFWPYRNQMLVTLVAMQLMPLGLTEVILGAVSTDAHADSRRKFVRKLSQLMSFQEGAVSVSAPAARMTTVKLLRKSGFPRTLIGLTFSCHVDEYACGQCGGCRKHRDVVDTAFPHSVVALHS